MRKFLSSRVEHCELYRSMFDAAFCVNLDRRSDRWDKFLGQVPHDWPFPSIERFSAVDGKRVSPPEWWKQGGGAWGCYRSHLALIEQALNKGQESILLFEDDAVFCDGFSQKATEFLDAVPDDWGMIYFGGQHLFVNQNPPLRVNDLVFRPYNLNRTHAFALRGPTMRKVYQHLCTQDWKTGNHIDHHLGRFHQRRQDPIYCPREWLVGQADGQSNISGRVTPERFWVDSEVIDKVDPNNEPFVAVLGLHSSGSSCLAGVLYHLGLHLGNQLTGFYGNNPERNECGFEAVGLRNLCDTIAPFPSTAPRLKRGEIWRRLRTFINEKRREAANRGTIAAGKYPQLCQMGKPLISICGPNLRVIVSDRPVEHSIESMRRRFRDINVREIRAHQEWLEAGKQWTLQQLPPSQKLVVAYEELLADSAREAGRIADFLGISPAESQLSAVRSWVDRGKQHIKG